MKHQRVQRLISLAVDLDTCKSRPCAAPPAVDNNSRTTARHALLISSFTEGVLKSQEAQVFLRDGLLSSMLRHEAHQILISDSDSISSHSGSDDDDEDDDDASYMSMASQDVETVLLELEHKVVRLVYIPTAMFAPRKTLEEKSNTEQLRESRETARERRLQIASHVASLMGPHVAIQAVTVDLEDSSMHDAQVHGPTSNVPMVFPTNGRQALDEWKPHLVYIEGGNTFWLYHCMEKGHWKESIMNAVTGQEAAVFCGKSAGAILAGATVDTATWKEWDDPSVVSGREHYEDWKLMQGLDLIQGTSIFPHMGEQWKPTVARNRERVKSPVHCISDSEICLYDGLHREFSVVTALA